jgi:predicted negative regulator of RcsB-dependent stress response
MNEVFENNTALGTINNFVSKNRIPLIISLATILVTGFIFFAINFIKNSNNEKAGKIYNKLISQDIGSEEGKLISEELFTELLNSYKKTGYTKIALMNKASLYAKDNMMDQAIEYFSILKDLTNGFGGDELLNKIANINLARIYYSIQDYDKALKALEKYDSSSNALIHELLGDILSKQKKIDLAKNQYLLAKELYTDEVSTEIVAMKLTNLN